MRIALVALLALSALHYSCKKRPIAPNFSSYSKDANPEKKPQGAEPEDLGEDPDYETEPEDETDPNPTPTNPVKTPEKDPVKEPEKNPEPTPEDLNKKLEIKASGRQLLVDGKPFHMKGVCYAPVPKGAPQSQGPIFNNPSDNDLKVIEKDFQMMKDAGINTIRTYNVIENDKVLALLNKYQIFVIVPVLSGFDVKMEEVKRIVNKLKSHRSTLMWQVGNEWNYNFLYGGGSLENAKNIVRTAGQAIKSADKTIPMATNYGHQVDPNMVRDLPDYDIWGLNIYEGKTFSDAFTKYKSITNKPLYIGEFGADAYDAKSNRYNPEAQAEATEQLLRELDSNLSAEKPDNAAIGGTIFEWNDEWWKDDKGRPDQQDVGGIAPGGGPWPDLTFNEEWWGIVDIDRKIRPAYEKLKAKWKK